jgi:glutathione S-transferase
VPTLYSTALSANGRKVLAVARHLGVRAGVREVNVYRGEGRTSDYLAIHPSGKIPALVDGDFVLWESNAILQYLDEAYGDFRLSSRDARRRADVARWMFFEASQWQPTLVPVLSARVGHLLLPDLLPAPARAPTWEDAALAPVLGLVEAHLAARDFFTGSDLTLADFAMAGMATYFRACDFPFASFPGLRAWYARVEALPAWRDTAAPPWDRDS